MTWRMVDNKHHKAGFGKLLLLHRIEQAKEIYPGIKIALGTTQHTFPFFEKSVLKRCVTKKTIGQKDWIFVSRGIDLIFFYKLLLI